VAIRGVNLIRAIRLSLGQDRGFGLSVPLSDAQIIYAIKTSISAYGRYHPRFSYQSTLAPLGKSEFTPVPAVRGIRQLSMVPVSGLLPLTLPEMALIGGQFISFGTAIDYNLVEQYCLSPDTKILTTDLRWATLGEARIGDELIGFDENAIARDRRRFKRTRIEHLSRVTLPSVKITMSNGIEVICSRNHRWLSLSPCGGNIRWRDTRTEVRSLSVGNQIYTLGPPWAEENTRESGWLAGVIDGEGWLSKAQGNPMGIAQCPGEIHSAVHAALASRGFTCGDRATDDSEDSTTDCRTVSILGGFTQKLRLLGSVRPLRLLQKAPVMWEGTSVGASEVTTIVSIEDVGEVDLISIGTGTQTLVANGLLSHNSIYLQWKDAADTVFSNKPSYCHLPDINKIYFYNPSSSCKVSFQGEMDWYINPDDDVLWDESFNDSNTADPTDQKPSVPHPEHLDEALGLIPENHVVNWVRKLALGESMKILGRMFSRYGSIPGVDGKDIQLNGPALLEEGKEIWEEALTEVRLAAVAMIPPVYR
jgi:hypothetical protein